MLAGRPFKVEWARCAVCPMPARWIHYGETCVMQCRHEPQAPALGVDFFPLNGNTRRSSYAAGRIPGSFMRREGHR